MRSKLGWLTAAAMLVLGLATTTPATTEESQARPEVSVVDGDSLEIDGELVRLFGIDAPELGQTCLNGSKRWRCGLQAALELRRLIELWDTLTCARVAGAPGERLATCHNADFEDPVEKLLARGLAVAAADATPAYKRAEVAARKARLGIWRGDFVPPADWRQGVRLSGPDDSPAEVCDVKGTITAEGERVYYVPTDRSYDALEIRPELGETMFCSDDAAELAGWRRFPKR